MARARNLKPSFFTNDVLAEIEPLGRLLFQGLWCLADREGRLEDRPKKIKAELLPYDDCDADSLLAELHDRGFILRYSANGTRYIQVVTFCKHQNPHVKEAQSTIPAPCEHSAGMVQEQDEQVIGDDPEPEIPERAGLIPPSLNPLPDSPSPMEGRASRSDRGSHLPKDWQPSGEEISFCHAERPDLNPRRVADEFRDYWTAKPGKDGRKTDWPATWRNWVRRQKGARSPPPNYHDERAETIAGLTGRSRHDDERTIDVPATRIA